jgi:hypothetical protein
MFERDARGRSDRNVAPKPWRRIGGFHAIFGLAVLLGSCGQGVQGTPPSGGFTVGGSRWRVLRWE